MHIPDTPEALFEALAEPSIPEVYPFFETLTTSNQKLLRLLHTELTKGKLSDEAFQQMVGFLISVWRSFNQSALRNHASFLDHEDELALDEVGQHAQLARLDQSLLTLLALLETIPTEADAASPEDEPSGHYVLRDPADS